MINETHFLQIKSELISGKSINEIAYSNSIPYAIVRTINKRILMGDFTYNDYSILKIQTSTKNDEKSKTPKLNNKWFKRILVNNCGGGCIKCGYNKSLAALHFHHYDSKTKLFNVSDAKLRVSIDKIISEVKKCVLVCSNCHCEIHDGLITISMNDIVIVDEVKLRKEYYDNVARGITVIDIDCPNCNIMFTKEKNKTHFVKGGYATFCKADCYFEALRNKMDLRKINQKIIREYRVFEMSK